MRAHVLPRYDRLGASSRLRMLQYVPSLRAEGFQVELSPFFADAYLTKLYTGKSTRGHTVEAYSRRVRSLVRKSQVDVLWIEKEAFPWLPWFVERAALPRRVPFVLDFDDAVFHRYDLHRSPLVRAVLGRKLDRAMAASALVTAGNAYLADRARAAGAHRIEIVPTVVDLEAYTLRHATQLDSAPAIGWIGTPSTWSEYMAPMMPLLTGIAGAEGARLVAVGAGKDAEAHPTLDSLPWSEETEIASIQVMDVGIMPLTDTPWARGKCGYKLIQYMACGLPVVASPVGVNAEIVEHGVNGFLATTDVEWREALTILLRDPALRHRMGQEGRRKVERAYSLHVWGPRVVSLLRDVVEKGRTA